MKRFSLLMLLLCAAMFSCKDTGDKTGQNGFGAISINGVTDPGIDLVLTRAGTDVSEYTYILQNESDPGIVLTGLLGDLPEGTVIDIPAGSYSLTLTSHPGASLRRSMMPGTKGSPVALV